jgi:hypothetical protein
VHLLSLRLYDFFIKILVPSAKYLGTQALVNRRLEDKIRYLCALATVANDDDAWLLLSELRILITQHIEHLRIVAAGKLAGAAEFVERRSDSNASIKPPLKPPLAGPGEP